MAHRRPPAYANVAPTTRRRMQAVRSENTAPEIQVRRLLHSMGYRFRLHSKRLPGTPDIVLSKHKKIILIHGCFWHGHDNCLRAKLPINNVETWREKIASNRARDLRNILALKNLGWNVLVVWECETRDQVALTKHLTEFLLES
ncbi:TPA: very short patch repair endonuclease [Pseudomonas aeruginosa]|nr:DNA mismatch endonuclease Vsr [Pseudomonas aeruginosa]